MSSILEDAKTAVESVGLPVETGTFTDTTPDQYAVVIPYSDDLELYADNKPEGVVQSARISLFCKGSYTTIKNALVRVLLFMGMTITNSRYIEYEQDTGYHHYNIDIENFYIWEE